MMVGIFNDHLAKLGGLIGMYTVILASIGVRRISRKILPKGVVIIC
jgi:hypothetical protein